MLKKLKHCRLLKSLCFLENKKNRKNLVHGTALWSMKRIDRSTALFFCPFSTAQNIFLREQDLACADEKNEGASPGKNYYVLKKISKNLLTIEYAFNYNTVNS